MTPAAYPRVAPATACAIAGGACSLSRAAHRAGPALPSYLALHHAGFSVPRLSPNERWALTPPFHPYRGISFRGRLAGFPARCHRAPFHRRFIFCGTFREPHRTHDVRRSPPDVIRRVAHRFPTLRPETSVSGLSSRPRSFDRDQRSPSSPAKLIIPRVLFHLFGCCCGTVASTIADMRVQEAGLSRPTNRGTSPVGRRVTLCA